MKGQTDCQACLQGFYCTGATVHPIPCPAGFYCGASTIKPTMCGIGTYGGSVGLGLVGECTDCPPGSFCAEPGAQAPTGKCDAGFICFGSSTKPRTDAASAVADTGVVEVCPKGGYCEMGSVAQKACKGGYYNPNEGGKTVYDC